MDELWSTVYNMHPEGTCVHLYVQLSNSGVLF